MKPRISPSRSLCRSTTLVAGALALAAAGLPLPGVAENEPLVLVVHGIGGGNRADGWADDIAKTWRTPVTEVTFRMEGRTDSTSLTDFARHAGDWALEVRRQIQDAVRANPGRRVVVVSHSWGTVATKIALDGGTGGGTSAELVASTYGVPPIDLGGIDVDEWVTLGSPLGRAEDPNVAGNLRQLNVDVPVGRPKVVKHWTNIYDDDDPVSRQSHDLDGAENIKVTGSGSWWDVVGLTAHTGIWQNRRVVERVRARVTEVAALPPPAPPQPPPAAAQTSPEGKMYQRLADALVKLNEQDCARRNAEYPGHSYRIDYLYRPVAKFKDGAWYIVASWQLMLKAPDRDQYSCAFQRGDADAPQWITTSEVDAWVSRAGINWR